MEEGETTVCRQLENPLDEEGLSVEQRKHLYQELVEDVRAEVEAGYWVVIRRDFNESYIEKGLMHKSFEELTLVNMFHLNLKQDSVIVK